LTDHLFQLNPHIQIKAAYEIQNHIDLIVTHNAVDLFEATDASVHNHDIKAHQY